MSETPKRHFEEDVVSVSATGVVGGDPKRVRVEKSVPSASAASPRPIFYVYPTPGTTLHLTSCEVVVDGAVERGLNGETI